MAKDKDLSAKLLGAAKAIAEVATSLSESPTDKTDRRRRFLQKIADKGGLITKAEFNQTAKESGYDARGAGGFFVGPGSSLVSVWVNGKIQVALTLKAKEELSRK